MSNLDFSMVIKKQPDNSRQMAFMEVCPDCHGNGCIVTYYQYAAGQFEPDECNCDRCGRTGMIISKVSDGSNMAKLLLEIKDWLK